MSGDAAMFVPDDAHRERVADAVRTAGLTGVVELRLSAIEADNLHTAAVNHYRQVREELDQPTRNMVLAVLQVLDEAAKSAFAYEEAQRQHHWRFMDRAAAVLLDELGLSINARQGAQLCGRIQGMRMSPASYTTPKLVEKLAELTGVQGDLEEDDRPRYEAVAERLMALYKETETVPA